MSSCVNLGVGASLDRLGSPPRYMRQPRDATVLCAQMRICSRTIPRRLGSAEHRRGHRNQAAHHVMDRGHIPGVGGLDVLAHIDAHGLVVMEGMMGGCRI